MPTLAEVYRMEDALVAHLAALSAAGRTDQTIKSRASVLGRFAEHLAPRSLLDADEDDVVIWLNNPAWSKATRRTYHANLAAFYAWAERRDKIHRSPMRGMMKQSTPKRPPRAVTDSDFAAAVEVARPRTRVWLVLARYAGLRAAEIAALKPGDIHWDADALTVHGKGDKEAVLPMHPIVAAELRYWVDTHDGATWTSTPDDVSQAGNHALHKVGSTATFHGCRHGFAMHLYDTTGDPAIVSRMLRHSSLAVTQVYVQARDDGLASAVANMGLTAS